MKQDFNLSYFTMGEQRFLAILPVTIRTEGDLREVQSLKLPLPPGLTPKVCAEYNPSSREASPKRDRFLTFSGIEFGKHYPFVEPVVTFFLGQDGEYECQQAFRNRFANSVGRYVTRGEAIVPSEVRELGAFNIHSHRNVVSRVWYLLKAGEGESFPTNL